MCSGKTLAGRALARALGRRFSDSDAAVKLSSGLSAGDFIRKKGLAAFRRAEAAAVGALARAGGGVVALGGGFYPSGRRARLLASTGVTVFLHCPWPELEKRLRAARGPRPLLAGPWEKAAARARKLYSARLPYYRRADITVSAAGLSPAAAAARIKKALKKRDTR
ncbi:MAG: hypothetical protein M0025_05015 [Elusimicrobia bacterium]|nr:hypothetical protein [Elusimicrobiota bacterium]